MEITCGGNDFPFSTGSAAGVTSPGSFAVVAGSPLAIMSLEDWPTDACTAAVNSRGVERTGSAGRACDFLFFNTGSAVGAGRGPIVE